MCYKSLQYVACGLIRKPKFKSEIQISGWKAEIQEVVSRIIGSGIRNSGEWDPVSWKLNPEYREWDPESREWDIESGNQGRVISACYPKRATKDAGDRIDP